MWNAFRTLIGQYLPVSHKEFELARRSFRDVELSKKSYFVEEGNVCKELAFVHKGILRSFYIDDNGEDVTYCFCTANQIETSFKSFLLQEPSFISIQAIEDAELLVIDKASLNELFEVSPFWNKIGRLITEQEYLKMELHAAEIKAGNAKENYIKLIEKHPDLIRKVPLHYIASYLGITSRHLTRLRREVD